MRKGSFWVIWFPVLLYLGLIFTLSQMSHPPVPDAIPGNILHYPEFAVLGWLVVRALSNDAKGMYLKSAPLWAFIATVLVGLLDEFHQAFIPGRLPDIHDWYRDITGAFLGILAWGIWRWARRSWSR